MVYKVVPKQSYLFFVEEVPEMSSGVYGAAVLAERPAERRTRTSPALLVSLGMCVAVAAVLFISNMDSRPAELFSRTIQFSNGQRAELSRRDFVPLSRDGASSTSKQARHEIAGLYAAAGMEMRVHNKYRQQELAQVPNRQIRAPEHEIASPVIASKFAAG